MGQVFWFVGITFITILICTGILLKLGIDFSLVLISLGTIGVALVVVCGIMGLYINRIDDHLSEVDDGPEEPEKKEME